MNFTPACDGCECGVPVHGLLLESAYLWQLEPSLSLCRSLCLTLCLCMSLSLFHSASFFINLPLCLRMTKCPLPPTPPTPIRGRVCSAEEYLTISGMAGRCGQKMSSLFISKDQIDNIQFLMPSRFNKFPTMKFAYLMLLRLPSLNIYSFFFWYIMWHIKLPKYTVTIYFWILSFQRSSMQTVA